jgi:DNA-binding LytR/AlgR family response regulator
MNSPAPDPTPSPGTLTALVADDEEAPREQLCAALRRAWPELHLETAVNGADAWDRWLELEPALCFLDIRMPGLSGIDVARRIGGRTPVVFVSAFGDHALAAFDAGAVDYLLKPVDPSASSARSNA